MTKKNTQLHSKRLTIVHAFQPETETFDFNKKVERAPQEEQNGTNFSFTAPSSEEQYHKVIFSHFTGYFLGIF